MTTRNSNSVFAQANRPDAAQSGDREQVHRGSEPSKPPLAENGDLHPEKPGKVDEHFVKTKFDSMCGHPRKIKFQFYNINLANYDSQLYHHAQEFVDKNCDFENEVTEIDDLREVNQKNQLDLHHYERDETLGNFLVRIAQ